MDAATGEHVEFRRDAWRALASADLAEACDQLPRSEVVDLLASTGCRVKPRDLRGGGGRLVLQRVGSDPASLRGWAQFITAETQERFRRVLNEHQHHPTVEELSAAAEALIEAGSSPALVRLTLARAVEEDWIAAREAEAVLLTNDTLILPGWVAARDRFEYEPKQVDSAACKCPIHGEPASAVTKNATIHPAPVPADHIRDAAKLAAAAVAAAQAAVDAGLLAVAKVEDHLRRGVAPADEDLGVLEAVAPAFVRARSTIDERLLELGGNRPTDPSIGGFHASISEILLRAEDAAKHDVLATRLGKLSTTDEDTSSAVQQLLDRLARADDTELAKGVEALLDVAEAVRLANPAGIASSSDRALFALPSEFHRLVTRAMLGLLTSEGAPAPHPPAGEPTSTGDEIADQTDSVQQPKTVNNVDPPAAHATSDIRTGPHPTDGQQPVAESGIQGSGDSRARSVVDVTPARSPEVGRAAGSDPDRAESPALPPSPDSADPGGDPQDGTATPTATPTGVAGSAPSEADDPAYQVQLEAAGRAHLLSAIAEGRFALAAWLSEPLALADADRATLATATVVSNAWSTTGQGAARASTMLTALPLREVIESPTSRLLAVASAVRLALVAPASGATTVLRQLRGDVTLDASTELLLDASLRFAEAGSSISATEKDSGDDPTTHVDAARLFLTEALQRNTPYQLASAVWRSWLQPKGVLAQLLQPARDDERASASQVGARATELLDHRAVERLIDVTTTKLRPQKKTRITAPSRTILFDRVIEAATIALGWSEAVGRARSNHADVLRRDLLAALDKCEAHLARSFAASLPAEADELAQAAATGAAGLVAALAPLVRGAPSPMEISPDDALLEPLYLAYEVVVRDGEPLRPIPLAPLVRVADGRSWEEGFFGRCAQGDFDIAERLLDALGLDDAAYQGCADRLAERLAAQRSALESLSEQCRVELDTAHRQGLLPDDIYELMFSLITAGWERDRKDLRRVRGDLENVREELRAARLQALEHSRAELAAAALPDEAHRQIAALLQQEEIATARAYLELARRGHHLPERDPAPVALEHFYPRIVDQLDSQALNRTVLNSIRAGTNFGPIGWNELAADEREVAWSAAAAWLNLGSDRAKTGHNIEDLRKVLGILGIDRVDNVRFDEDAPTRVQPRRWVSLVGRHNGHALVPQFGSELKGRYQLLLCWDHPSEANVREWITSHDGAGGILVLYFGLAPMAFRRQLAEVFRRPGPHNRPAVLIDDAIFLYCSTLPRPSYEIVMRLGLPFASVNPYQPFRAGLVPPEMFYGRRREISQLLRSDGPSVVYGGRQLGKSALLRAIEREMGTDKPRRALFIDLAGHEFSRESTDDFWRAVDEGLGRIEIPVGKASSAKILAERVTRRISDWLAADPDRQLFLLVDEVDRFLNADDDMDVDHPFPNVWRLKRLRDDTGGRFKPILAGLHHVARFRTRTNSPFTHLESLVVGPLVPQEAFDLVDKPLGAIGYAIEESAVNRILAYTHFNPGLIQLFCRELVTDLAGRPRQMRPVPSPVTTADIERVHAAVELTKQIRERFMATLHLDHRYLVICFAMAREADLAGAPTLVAISEISRLCESYWPEGFSAVPHHEFRSLLTELVDLGVLREQGTEYGIAGPHVRLMLGPPEEIELGLLQTEDLVPPPHRQRASGRAVLDEANHRRMTLTDAQLDVVTRAQRPTVILGTTALHVHNVVADLQALSSRRHQFTVSETHGVDEFVAALATQPQGELRTIVTLGPDSSIDVLTESLVQLENRNAQHISPVLVFSPAGQDEWQRLFSLEQGVNMIVLERWRRDGLHRALAELLDTPATPAQVKTAVRVTGGWPDLAETLLQVASKDHIDRALQVCRDLVADPDWSAKFLRSLGVAQDGDLERSFTTLIEFGPGGLEPEELAILADVPDGSEAAKTLRYLGLAEVGAGGKLVAEPVAANAWTAPRG